MTIIERIAIYVIVALFVSAGIWAAVFQYQRTLKANAVMKEQIEELRSVNAENEKAFAAKDAQYKELDRLTAEQRKRDQNTLNAILGIRKDLDGLRKTDPAVRAWADGKLPPAIADRLRADVASGEAGSGEAASARKPAGDVPRAPAARGH